MQPRILLAHVPWRDISQLLLWLATAGATSLTVPRRYIQIARSAYHLAPLLLFFLSARTLNAPYGRLLIRILLSIPFFPVSSLSSVLSEYTVRRASSLFRHAREPLISADFARRVDPWNPCSCLSPAPTRAGNFHPFSRLPSTFYHLPSLFSFLSCRVSFASIRRRFSPELRLARTSETRNDLCRRRFLAMRSTAVDVMNATSKDVVVYSRFREPG